MISSPRKARQLGPDLSFQHTVTASHSGEVSMGSCSVGGADGVVILRVWYR